MLRNRTSPLVRSEWKRINMRQVTHLLGVEFIHDLYNRYDPRINAVRFRHTVTTWKDGVVNSYAPLEEWTELGHIVGDRYYALDPAIIAATRSLYRRKRTQYGRLMRSLGHTRLSELTNAQLAFLLLNFQSLVLGDLYVLNFVQVEHGLNIAIKRILSECVDEQEVEATFVNLIRTEVPTESQREKRKLHALAVKWRVLANLGMYRDEEARKDVHRHCEHHSYLYSAYGENPKSFDDFWHEFKTCVEGGALPHVPLFPRVVAKTAGTKLHSLHNHKLNVLVPLLVCGGIFRDKNKALLGKSLKYRFAILDEIGRRGLEERGRLDFYLLAEIVDLLLDQKQLANETVETRKMSGLVLTRSEDLMLITSDIEAMLNHEPDKILKGQCASPGTAEGVAKIVFSKDDVEKVKKGDIMVAIGTDFDVIEAMYRASAVITEEGGILSHASVVCRELNKPCCIGVRDATRTLLDGQRIRVDASAGTITMVG